MPPLTTSDRQPILGWLAARQGCALSVTLYTAPDRVPLATFTKPLALVAPPPFFCAHPAAAECEFGGVNDWMMLRIPADARVIAASPTRLTVATLAIEFEFFVYGGTPLCDCRGGGREADDVLARGHDYVR